MITFETIEQLESATLKEGDLVQVLGEFSEGDVALMTGKVYPPLHTSSNRIVTIQGGLQVEIFPTPLGDKDVTKKYVNQQDNRIKASVNNLHTTREAIEYVAGLKVTDPLQLYSFENKEYLPEPSKVPFTTIGAVIDNTYFCPIWEFGYGVNITNHKNDLIDAIKAANGKPILVNSDITVTETLNDYIGNVHIIGNGTITFEKNFLMNFKGSFVAEGVGLHSDTPLFVVSWKSDSVAKSFILKDGVRLSGAIRFIYNNSGTLDPDVTKHGIDLVKINGISLDTTTESLMYFDNMPYSKIEVTNNTIKNCGKLFLSSAIGNSHPHASKVQNAQKLMLVSGNNYYYTDDFWTTPNSTTTGFYGGFIFHEGKEIRYHDNTVDGIKSRRLASDPNKSCTTAYWLYMGGIDSYVHDNNIKNCFQFGSSDNPNVAFKLKQTTNLHAHNNIITFDGDWLARIGETITATDLHVIHDVEPGNTFLDVNFHDNTIEMIANSKSISCNASKYNFTNNIVRKGPTPIANLLLAFPTIDYTNSTLSSKPVFNFESNMVTNEGGNVVGPYVTSRRTSPFAHSPIIMNTGNKFVCNVLSAVNRVRGNEDYIITISNNAASVTDKASFFSAEIGNANATSVKGLGNVITSLPATLTTQNGFGLIPFSKQTDLSMNLTSEGSFELGRFGSDTAPNSKFLITGSMKSSEGIGRFEFKFGLSNVGGVNQVTFIDADGLTNRVVTETSGGFFVENTVTGSKTRLYISGPGGVITLGMSESSEGVITDPSVAYDINLYSVRV